MFRNTSRSFTNRQTENDNRDRQTRMATYATLTLIAGLDIYELSSEQPNLLLLMLYTVVAVSIALTARSRYYHHVELERSAALSPAEYEAELDAAMPRRVSTLVPESIIATSALRLFRPRTSMLNPSELRLLPSFVECVALEEEQQKSIKEEVKELNRQNRCAPAA